MSTVTALQLKSRFFQYEGTYRALTATGGSTAKFTVASLADLEPDSYAGWQLRVLTGAAAGDLRRLGAGPNAAGDLEPKRAFSAAIVGPSVGPPVVVADTGELWGNSIDGGQELTDLFNMVLKVAKPVDEAKITIVTSQRFYDVTATVANPRDFIWAYRRRLDPANLEPYDPEPLQWCEVRPLSVAGAYTLQLEICPALTLQSPAVEELWIKYRKTLTAFTTDSSTVDAQYADWLAWRAVLLHALDMQAKQTDKGRWQGLAEWAAKMVQPLDAAYMPYIPKYQRPERPM